MKKTHYMRPEISTYVSSLLVAIDFLSLKSHFIGRLTNSLITYLNSRTCFGYFFAFKKDPQLFDCIGTPPHLFTHFIRPAQFSR